MQNFKYTKKIILDLKSEQGLARYLARTDIYLKWYQEQVTAGLADLRLEFTPTTRTDCDTVLHLLVTNQEQVESIIVMIQTIGVENKDPMDFTVVDCNYYTPDFKNGFDYRVWDTWVNYGIVNKPNFVIINK